MITPLGKLLPPDPPEKWKAIESALESDEKARRMGDLINANAKVTIACLALVLATVVVLLMLALLLQ